MCVFMGIANNEEEVEEKIFKYTRIIQMYNTCIEF